MVSTSPISRSWRAARSISSRSMPLTSRRRSTARPATARPSASSGRPARGGERHHEAAAVAAQRHRPRAACVAPPPAPARRRRRARAPARAPDTTMPVSPKISGASPPAAQATSTCGSRQQQRLEPVDLGAQRHGLVVRGAFMRGGGLARAQQHDGGEHREAEQPERQRERGEVLAADSRAARIMSSTRLKATPAPAWAGVRARCKIVAKTKAARNPPRLGRERSLSFAVRIVSGIQACPRNASGVRRAVRESPDFTPAGTQAERVQIVNGSRMTVRNDAYFSASARFAMSSTLMRPSADEKCARLRPAPASPRH